MDNLNYLVFKMAIRLVELKVRDIDSHIEKIRGFPLHNEAVAKLNSERTDLKNRIKAMQDSLMNQNHDEIQAHVNALTELDLF